MACRRQRSRAGPPLFSSYRNARQARRGEVPDSVDLSISEASTIQFNHRSSQEPAASIDAPESAS